MPPKAALTTPDEDPGNRSGAPKSRRTRANSEGSIFPYRNGYAAYVWVTTPDGAKKRKWAYGKTRDETHKRWLKLHEAARKGPVVTKSQSLSAYLNRWLNEVVRPNLAPATASNYDMFVRLYIAPKLGSKRLDKLTLRDVQTWHNQLKLTCHCCAQGKDAKRPKSHRNPKVRQRCCAVGNCCSQLASERTVRDAWTVLRAALNNAVREELLPRNVAALRRVNKPRRKRVKPWSVDEARQLLESARTNGDPLYPAYVLILCLGLRHGELLRLRWKDVDLDAEELTIGWQLQRIGGKLLHRQTKTESSDAPLPLIDMCITALRERKAAQDTARIAAKSPWPKNGLVFTTRTGHPIEPRNFNRSFAKAIKRAEVRQIPVHATRKTCASLLVALDVHPRIAMQILRHSQIAVTMNIYSEVSSEDTRKALKKLGEKLL
ncbi:site-specific integrase [Sinosporangium siamense]|uniref:Site-specific integrase n=1 Tax=Sinosporangium siamense TaxID=1367973 RepID=A0A919VA15_9ACTN|nr:site-specific integrase [Sinosporangium siamense]GII94922.1 site-specific integrase [Sinosporangium siamense]